MRLHYITGRGGSVDQGLSLYLSTLTRNYQALANNSELHKLAVNKQIDVVAQFCAPATHLIANSYGAYLWLLSRIDAEPSHTKVLLPSPVMGRVIGPEKMLSSRPPRLRGLENAISEGRITLPQQVRVLTGKNDDACNSQAAVAQCAKLGITHLSIA